MTALVMALVVMAALLPVAAGVWVALALMAALRRNGRKRFDKSSPSSPS
jgi:hypothetical protein